MNNILILTILINLCSFIVGVSKAAFVFLIASTICRIIAAGLRKLKKPDGDTKLSGDPSFEQYVASTPPTRVRAEMPPVKPPRKSAVGLSLNSVAPIPRSPRRNLGRFYASDVMVENYWESMLVVMASIVPVQVGYRHEIQAYEYLAHSTLFDEVPEGMLAPLYECHFKKVPVEGGEGHTITFEFKRVTAPKHP